MIISFLRQDKSHLDRLQDRIIKGIFYNNTILITKVQLGDFLYTIFPNKIVLKILKSGYKKQKTMPMSLWF